MSIIIKPDTKIFIAAPANHASGGPELLHQLGEKLKERNLKSVMYYYKLKDCLSPVHSNYTCYDLPYITDLQEVSRDDILIVPETTTYFLNKVNAQKIIWWLSVGNYLKVKNKEEKRKRKISSLWKKHESHFSFSNPDKNKILHLYQSEYAKDYLIQNGISNLAALSDYLRDDFKNCDISKVKKGTIAYYPKKGTVFTDKLRKNSPNLEWIAIENMTPLEVKQLLNSCKVYVDFGHHPGKDRIPREAVISDCCVITSLQGAARFYKDVPIKDNYKYEDKDENICKIISMIENCIKDYDQHILNFKDYKAEVENQEQVFESEVDAIFCEQAMLNNKVMS